MRVITMWLLRLALGSQLWGKHPFEPFARQHIAGLWNSGTNFAYMQLFQLNCNGGRWSAPYGKHTFVNENAELPRNDVVLVVVKHPLSWMKSMCERRSYGLTIQDKRACYPSSASRATGPTYMTLIDVWIDFHSRYRYNVSFPVKWVRYEDILFHTEEVTRRHCNHHLSGVKIMQRPSKAHQAGETNYSAALTRYSDATISSFYTVEQLAHIKRHTGLQEWLDFFGYTLPL